MTPKITKTVLILHIIASVGWLGSVAVFVALVLTSVNTSNPVVADGMLIAMQISARYVIVPFSFLALVTGVIQAIGTKWGLFKYYWIIVKLSLTAFSTILLIIHLNSINMLAKMTMQKLAGTYMNKVQLQVLFDAAAGLTVLIFITAISIYKPWGRVSYSLATMGVDGNDDSPVRKLRRKYMIPITITVVIIAFLLIHLFTGGLHVH